MSETTLRIDRKTETTLRGFAVRDASDEIVAWIQKRTLSSPVYAGGHRYSVGSTRRTVWIVRDAEGQKRGEARTQARALDIVEISVLRRFA